VKIRRLIPSLGATIVALGVWATAAVAAPPANTAAPTITGTAKVGETLTAQNGTWSNNPTAFQYQWQRCNASGAACANILGATAKTYLLTPADAGRTMRVRVTGINAEGAVNARSAPTAVVAPSAAPRNTARPTISGEPQAGEELTAEEGSWTNSPTSYTYQWQRCDVDVVSCGPITGATGKTYGVRNADVGFRLRVEVVAKNANGSGSALSAPSGFVVPSVPITNARPTVKLISVRFLGARVYARFRICDDSPRNLTIFARESKPGKVAYTRRFTTRIAPNPCGVYTRNWVPVPRLRGKGLYTVTISARDTSGRTSAPVRRTLSLR
jgi:hypothetical protein